MSLLQVSACFLWSWPSLTTHIGVLASITKTPVLSMDLTSNHRCDARVALQSRLTEAPERDLRGFAYYG